MSVLKVPAKGLEALLEAQAVVQLIDELHGATGTEPDEPDQVERVQHATRLARRRLDEAVDEFFGGK